MLKKQKKVKKFKERNSYDTKEKIAIDMKKRGIKPKNIQEWFESNNETRASYQLRHGDDWW